jgi:hypothetical protein
VREKTNQKKCPQICRQYQKFSNYPDLALLWMQTGKSQYKLCFNLDHMAKAISMNEFYNYFSSMRCEQTIVFSDQDDGTVLAVNHCYNSLLSHELFQTVFNVTTITSRFVSGYEYKFDDGTYRYCLLDQVELDKKEIIT